MKDVLMWGMLLAGIILTINAVYSLICGNGNWFYRLTDLAFLIFITVFIVRLVLGDL